MKGPRVAVNVHELTNVCTRVADTDMSSFD